MAAGVAEGVRLRMCRRIVLLDTAVVATPEELPLSIKQGGAYGNTALRVTLAGFLQRNL